VSIFPSPSRKSKPTMTLPLALSSLGIFRISAFPTVTSLRDALR
jgi:hypothetical protein